MQSALAHSVDVNVDYRPEYVHSLPICRGSIEQCDWQDPCLRLALFACHFIPNSTDRPQLFISFHGTLRCPHLPKPCAGLYSGVDHWIKKIMMAETDFPSLHQDGHPARRKLWINHLSKSRIMELSPQNACTHTIRIKNSKCNCKYDAIK